MSNLTVCITDHLNIDGMKPFTICPWTGVARYGMWVSITPKTPGKPWASMATYSIINWVSGDGKTINCSRGGDCMYH